LDGFTETVIEITTARGRHARAGKAIVHRWTDPEPSNWTTVDGIRSTNVAVTLSQLGAVESATGVERALDGALRQGVSLRWIRDTAQRLHRPGPSGTTTLLRLLDDPVRRGQLPDSHFERLVQRLLAHEALPTPELQDLVVFGDRRFRVDVAWPEIKYGIECHSRSFHFGPSSEAADNVRDHELGAVGWHLDYVTWWEIEQPDRLVSQIAAVHARRTRQLSPSHPPTGAPDEQHRHHTRQSAGANGWLTRKGRPCLCRA
jgi:hypothetical protein